MQVLQRKDRGPSRDQPRQHRRDGAEGRPLQSLWAQPGQMSLVRPSLETHQVGEKGDVVALAPEYGFHRSLQSRAHNFVAFLWGYPDPGRQ